LNILEDRLNLVEIVGNSQLVR